MCNPEFFHWLETLGKDQCFQDCICLTDKALDEQYDLELAVRFTRSTPNEE